MDIDADFIAPDGYNIFGIDGLENDLANQHSHVNRLALLHTRIWSSETAPTSAGCCSSQWL